MLVFPEDCCTEATSHPVDFAPARQHIIFTESHVVPATNASAVGFLLAQVKLQRDREAPMGAFLLDDISSELDAGHRTRIIGALRELDTQVFVTAIDDAAIDAADWCDASLIRPRKSIGRRPRENTENPNASILSESRILPSVSIPTALRPLAAALKSSPQKAEALDSSVAIQMSSPGLVESMKSIASSYGRSGSTSLSGTNWAVLARPETLDKGTSGARRVSKT